MQRNEKRSDADNRTNNINLKNLEIMKVFKTTQEAVKFLKEIDFTSSKDKFVDDILNNGICKVGSTIIVVDENGILD